MRAGTASFVRRKCSTAALSGLAALLFACPARSEDPAVRAIIFDSLDAGPSFFSTAGVKVAPERVDREGFAGIAVVGGGLRFERGPAVPGAGTPVLVRTTLLAAALGGYQFFQEWGVVGLFAGPEMSRETLFGAPGVDPRSTRFGLRLQGEVWARPSADTLATATLILGSARGDVYARLSAGYRAWGAYLGPEVASYVDRTGYQKWSLGVHATEIALGAFTMRVSAGCVYESEIRQFAPYLALAGWISL